jgi:hypothetical protein
MILATLLFDTIQIRDYKEGDPEQEGNTVVHRSSMAFSIMCACLTVLYAGFAALVFTFSKSVLEELEEDCEMKNIPKSTWNYVSAPHSSVGVGVDHGGYNIGERFDVGHFVAKPQESGTMA